MQYALHSLKARWGILIILFALLMMGCQPVQLTADDTALSTNLGITVDTNHAAQLTWTGTPLGETEAPCGHLQIDSAGEATFGPCEAATQQAPLNALHQQEWTEIQAQFTAFGYVTDTTTLNFIGTGQVSGEIWQRALATWAQLVYSELAADQVSATGATTMSWFLGALPEPADQCQQLIVLRYGYAYANITPCSGGVVQTSTGGWLNDAELVQLDQWLTHAAPLYVEDNYLAGEGTQAADETTITAVEVWAQAVYARLQTSGRVNDTASDTATDTVRDETWKSYRADSGYVIAYPLTHYSLRLGAISPAAVLFPGVRVIEPNDSFTYRDANQEVYRLSIAVTVNSENLTLEQAETLLTSSPLIAYEPSLLEDTTIQQIELDGMPALRVDNLLVGPSGITTQIIAVHQDFIYELLVEPYTVTNNQDDVYVERVANSTNLNLIEEIISTFHFTD